MPITGTFLVITMLIVHSLIYGQGFHFKNVRAPFSESYILLELNSMIYEPGELSNLTLSFSPDSGANWVKAKSLNILFEDGREFHHGNIDSIVKAGYLKSKLNIDGYKIFMINESSIIYIDSTWLADARGELLLTLLWDAMHDHGEILSQKALFKIEGDYKYDDPHIFSKAGHEGSFTDPRDQQTYKIVQIGNKVWMSENLRYNAQFSNKKNDFVEKSEVGYKYSWWMAKRACPEGWSLPSEDDFNYLKSYYSNQKHLLPGGISSLNLQSILYDSYWEYWTGTTDKSGYAVTFKFDWSGLERNINNTGSAFTPTATVDKSLIRCVRDDK